MRKDFERIEPAPRLPRAGVWRVQQGCLTRGFPE